MGKGFASLALCWVALSLPPSTAAAEQCQLTKITDLATTVTPYNQILVDGSIKGEPVHLQVDSGTPLTVFDEAVISRFGVDNNKREIIGYGFGGMVKAVRAQIPGLKVGNFSATDIFLHVLESHFLDGDVYGLLGEDFLISFDLDIDLAHSKITLFDHNACPSEPVLWTDRFSEADLAINRNKVTILIEVNGVPMRARLDTGANRTVISTAFARRLGIDPDSPAWKKPALYGASTAILSWNTNTGSPHLR